jgi:hypothetical protein
MFGDEATTVTVQLALIKNRSELIMEIALCESATCLKKSVAHASPQRKTSTNTFSNFRFKEASLI